MAKDKGSYHFTRAWFDFAFENPIRVNTNHAALFLWFVELNNRLGWSPVFKITAMECMAAAGFKTYKPYKKTFDELIEFGFVELKQKSLNQYQCNIIALVKNAKATNKALDKATNKARKEQTTKHVHTNGQSISHIHLNQETTNQETFKHSERKNLKFIFDSENFKKKWEELIASEKWRAKSFAALQSTLNQLANFPEEKAIELIQEAISGEKSNLFEIVEKKHPLQIEVAEKYLNVAQIKTQLTFENCEFLTTTFSKALIDKKLAAMDNKPRVAKEYMSVFYTLRAWCEKEAEPVLATSGGGETTNFPSKW